MGLSGPIIVVVGRGGGGGGGGGHSYDTVCGAENGHFSCHGDRTQGVTTLIKSSIIP